MFLEAVLSGEEMRNKVLSVFFVLVMALITAPTASAATIWYQTWDSTPAFSGQFDKIAIEMGVGGGQFGNPMSNFSPTFGTMTTTFDPYLVTATSSTDLQGTPGTNNLWRINFGTALNQALTIQIKFYDGNTMKSVDTWHYRGTGTGNNPVSSWTEVRDDTFVSAVPEPASLGLLGVGLVGLASRLRRRP